MSGEILSAIRDGAYSSVYYASKNKQTAEDVAQSLCLKILENGVTPKLKNRDKCLMYGSIAGYRFWLDSIGKKYYNGLQYIDNYINEIVDDDEYSYIVDEQLYKAIEQLPHELCDYANQVLFGHKKNKEYAQSVGITLSAAKSRHYHLKKQLKKILNNE